MKVSFLLSMLLVFAALGAETNRPPARPGLEITAKFAEFRLKDNTAYYSNNVVVFDPPAKAGDAPTIIHCRELTARRGANGKLESIVAVHEVEIDQGDTHARGQKAVYTATNERMVLTGPFPPFSQPLLFSSQGTNSGSEIVYDRLKDKLYITNVTTVIPSATLNNARTNSPGRTNNSAADTNRTVAPQSPAAPATLPK
jgi:lipopolysaccharide export system protein LptA